MRSWKYVRLSWEQLIQLVKKEIKIRYKDTFLGLFWIIMAPIIQALIISFLLVRIIGVRSGHLPSNLFPFIVLSGYVVWDFVGRTIGHGITTFTGHKELVTNQPIPLALLPIAETVIKFIDYLIEAAVLIVLLLIFQHHLSWALLGLIPLSASLFLFVAGLAFISSTLHILVRDTGHLVTFVLAIWYWVTPVFYPAELIPTHFKLINLNPLIHFLFAWRQIIFDGVVDPLKLSKILAMSMVVLLIGVLLFERVKGRIYDSV